MDRSLGSGIGERLGLMKGVAYALPHMGTLFLISALPIVKGLYAKHFGLSLTTIATVVLIARLFDAVTDPIVGTFSDRYSGRTGTRKPFIAAGGLLIVVSSYFLYSPPDNVSSSYFLVWYLAFYLAWTLFEIPHLAWGGEIAIHSQERTKIYTLRNGVGYIGSLLFFSIPLWPIFETNEFTPEMLTHAALMMGTLMLPLLYLCIKQVPDGAKGIDKQGNDSGDKHSGKDDWRLLLSSILGNKPLLIFLGAYFLVGIGAGMSASVFFIFVDTYLGLGNKLSLIYLIGMLAGLIAMLMWYQLSRYLDKKWAWGVGMVLFLLYVVGKGWLPPGESSFIPLVILQIVGYAGAAALGVFVPSILADIVDYGAWKFGTYRAATYFSVYAFVTKLNASLGAALGLAIAGWFGFDPAVSTHSEEGVFGLRLSISWLPALFMLLSLVFIYLTPITTRRHEIICRRLEARAKRVENKAVESTLSIGTATSVVNST